ncbi:hypothetical protein [Streptomyces sp. NPDC048277]|uniref:hypothetical protein n=1 Tax=Streptomyces sp. NPDC048277 TaxID=3155027 RepID=UPI00340C68CF
MRTRPRRAPSALVAVASLLLGASALDSAAVAPATAVPAGLPAGQSTDAGHHPSNHPAHAWKRSGLTQTLTANAGLGATIGYSSALSADGSTAVLGAPDANYYEGAVYVFHKSGGTWRQDAVLTQTDVQFAEIGFAVSVSDDGRTIAAGGLGSRGRVYVFGRQDTGWKQDAEFKAPAGGGLFDDLGFSVSVSGDGSTVAAGDFARYNNQGSVFVYDRTADGWSSGGELQAPDGVAGDRFGYANGVSLSYDGKALAVGAMSRNKDKGAVYTFTREDGDWTQTGELTAPDGAANERFGEAVALAGTGDSLVVGAPYHGTGVAYTYRLTGGSWTPTGELQAGGKRDFMSDAIAVDISGDGSVVGVGLPSRNGLYGAAAIFVRNSSRTGYTQHATLVPSEFRGTTGGAGTGLALSADGHTALVGAPMVAEPDFVSGVGFVYEDGAAKPGPGGILGQVAPSARRTTSQGEPPTADTPSPYGRTGRTRATSSAHSSQLAGRHPLLNTAHRTATACAAAPRPGYASCNAQVVTDSALKPLATTDYEDGYTPAQLQSAYGLKGLTGRTTVAVVDAYANPDAQKSLNAYRERFGLGPIHLTQVGQDGTSQLPTANSGWGTEEMLDLEMVSAACPTCSILYVGADSATFDDLGTAVNTAVKLGAKVVSNSYGGDEGADNAQIQAKYYQHPGVAITASSGDLGYGVSVPAAFDSVIAVGGTSLTLDASGTRTNETAWGDAGSGCSRFTAKPSWQHDGYCAHRTVSDVSAVADPDTGVAVYDSAAGGWLVVGGTSVSAPVIAGIYGLTGHTSGLPARRLYTAPGHSLYDVGSGLNGTCSSEYLCSGLSGYDGPSGVGSPNGVGAF